MKTTAKLTLSIEADVLEEFKELAKKNDVSISKFVTKKMREELAIEDARKKNRVW